ncbi:hypothetical protein SUGI_1171360 [Cryptomeria japonica]|nr:hypothetical protein SUGI_1171360 [Cryptomeria japonica]
MGFMLWIPAFIPKACTMKAEHGHMVVRCDEQGANMRANLQFSWYLASLIIFTVILYVKMMKHLVAYRAAVIYRWITPPNIAALDTGWSANFYMYAASKLER